MSLDWFYQSLQRYNSDGRRLGEYLILDSLPTDLAVTARGDLVMVKEAGDVLSAQVLTAEGEFDEPVEISNPSYPSDFPDIGANGNEFIVVWSSRGSAGSDDDGRSIQARRFIRPRIMGDGFSSGNLDSWSSAITNGCLPSRVLVCDGQSDIWNNGFGGSTRAEEDYPCLNNPHPGAEVAYSFSAPESGWYDLELTATTANLSLALISGEECDPGACVSGSEGASAGDRSIAFHANSGGSFIVLVESRAGQYSDYSLELTCP